MPATRSEPVVLDDGRALRMTLAEPEGVIRGGLVVLHEARGVTEPVRARLGALAAEGWLVAAPHLDHLAEESVLADVDIAFAWLARHGITADRIGVVGWEFGGAVAMMVAANRHVGAAVTVAGPGILQPLSDGLPALVDVAPSLRCPWLGLYGENAADEVEKLREAAINSGVATDVVLFPEAAFQAWPRVLNWFDAHLR